MLDKNFKNWLQDNPVLNGYYKKGYLVTKEDIQSLHMYYSPYVVQKGLTKTQIRWRINHYLKHGNKTKISDIMGNRLEIRINGEFILGASFGGEVPKNSKELQKLLSNLLKFQKSPRSKMPDNF